MVASWLSAQTQCSDMLSLASRRGEIERLVECEHGPFRVGALDEERDLDRRGHDEAGVGADVTQGSEGSGGDARVALHAGADQAHLGEPFDALTVGRGSVERSLSLAAVGKRRREDDLVTGL